MMREVGFSMRRIAIAAALLLCTAALPVCFASDEGGAHPRAEPRTVLFELFTAVNNTACADDENATHRLASEYSRDRLVILEWFPSGDPLACPQSQDRYRYYAVLSTPRGQVDGEPHSVDTTNESVSYRTYKDAIDARLNESSPVAIAGNLTQNGSHAAILQYNVSFKETTPNTLLKVYSFLYEDAVVYAGTSGVNIHRYVVRRQVHEQALTGAVFQPGGWARATVNIELDPSWNPFNVGVAVVLQSDATRSVLQSRAFTMPIGGSYQVDLEPGEQTLELRAGQAGEAEVRVKNTGAYIETVQLSLSGPAASWASLPQSSVTLAPLQETTVNVGVSVPAGTAPGGYQFTVKGTSREDPGKSDQVTVRVKVPEEVYYGVSLSPSSAEQSVRAGEAPTFQIKVKNTGTEPDTIDLQLRGDEPTWAQLSRTSLQLGAGEEDYTTLTVTVPGDANTGDYDYTVRGTSRADPSKYSEARARVRVSGQAAPSYGVKIQPAEMGRTVAPGGSASFDLIVTNTGSAEDIFDLSKTGNASGWALVSPISLRLGPSEEGFVSVRVDVPSSAGAAEYIVNVRATSRGDTTQRAEARLIIEVQLPEEPLRITMVSHFPNSPTSKDVVTITAVVSGTSVSRAEVTYIENGVSHGPERMSRNGTTFVIQLGPFKAKSEVKYFVTAYSESGKSNRSEERSFTVRAAPSQTGGGAPGFETLLVTGAVLLIVIVRRRLRPGQ
ncbi:MAG: hypothetical protein QW379_05160 [Thermoplasmata archaeon]